MQKCFFSTYTKPDKMASIKNDMEYYNSMKRYAFSLIVKQGGDGPVPGGTSIHNHLKEKFNVERSFRGLQVCDGMFAAQCGDP